MMRDVRVAACGFDHGQISGDAGGSGVDTTACAWSYSPTNFDPCELPAPVELHVTADLTLDTAATTLPKIFITQSDLSEITVIHLSQLTIDPTRTLTMTGGA